MQQIVRTIALAYNNLPRPHRVMLGSLTVVTLAVAVWRPFVYHPEHNPIAKSVELESSQMRSLLPEASEPIDADQPTPMTKSRRMSWIKKMPATMACMNMWFPPATPSAAF